MTSTPTPRYLGPACAARDPCHHPVPDKCRPHGVCAAGGECACEGGFVGEGCGEAAAAAAHLRAEFAIDAAAVLSTPAARAQVRKTPSRQL